MQAIKRVYWVMFVFSCMWGASLPGISLPGITLFPLRLFLLLSLALGIVLHMRTSKGVIRIDKNDKLVVSFLFIGIATIVWSCNREASISSLLVYGTSVWVLLLIKDKGSDERTFSYILDAIYVNMIIMGIAAIYECFKGSYLFISYEYYLRTYNAFGMIRPKAAFYNTNNLAVFYMLSLPFGIMAAERWHLSNIFKIIIFAFSTIIIVLTGSRMGLIGVLSFAGLYFFYKIYTVNKSKKILGIIIFIFILAISINFIPARIWTVFEGTSLSDETRWPVWEGAFNACRHYLFLGAGIGTSKYAYGSLGNAHNYLLEVLLEFGVFGLAVLVILLRRMTPSAKESKANTDLAYLRISFWMFILCSICSSSMQGFYHMWMYWGLSLVIIQRERKQTKHTAEKSNEE